MSCQDQTGSQRERNGARERSKSVKNTFKMTLFKTPTWNTDHPFPKVSKTEKRNQLKVWGLLTLIIKVVNQSLKKLDKPEVVIFHCPSAALKNVFCVANAKKKLEIFAVARPDGHFWGDMLDMWTWHHTDVHTMKVYMHTVPIQMSEQTEREKKDNSDGESKMSTESGRWSVSREYGCVGCSFSGNEVRRCCARLRFGALDKLFQ